MSHWFLTGIWLFKKTLKWIWNEEPLGTGYLLVSFISLLDYQF
jgi:hypothetical protein